jgi:carbamoyltransferase
VTAILGLNAYHGDSAAAILVDGELVGAVEEERFCRIKHWAGFPTQAIRWCLDEAGLSIGDLDHVALNRRPRANLGTRVGYTLRRRPSPKLVVERLRNARDWLSVGDALGDAFPGEELKAEVHLVEHHLAHLASAFWISPHDDAVVLSVDGFGDFASCAWGRGDARGVSIDERIFFPHSLGVFYEALTQFLGFPHFGDEYKVMGLAPYGEPVYRDELRRIVQLQPAGRFELDLRYFRHHTESVSYVWNNAAPQVSTLYSNLLPELLGEPRGAEEPLTQRHRDLARSVQAVYEDAFFNLLGHLETRYSSPRLCLAGGCGANSVANGKVQLRTGFTDLFTAPACGDAGGAVGSALHVWHELASSTKRATGSPFLGPHYARDAIVSLLEGADSRLAAAGCSIEELTDEQALCRRVAAAVADGQVVGWFQGRLEWGPRALGNRSIVCDPRRADMKDILNAKIKRRESFRPFAPSILREEAGAWFEQDDDVPYMSKVFQIREDRRALVPAVTHVDGSGRLQTVDREMNPRYHALIAAFAELTDVPMVLNTSFNENEPIVCRPDEALDCFLRTEMDLLVLGDHTIARR